MVVIVKCWFSLSNDYIPSVFVENSVVFRTNTVVFWTNIVVFAENTVLFWANTVIFYIKHSNGAKILFVAGKYRDFILEITVIFWSKAVTLGQMQQYPGLILFCLPILRYCWQKQQYFGQIQFYWANSIVFKVTTAFSRNTELYSSLVIPAKSRGLHRSSCLDKPRTWA